MTEKDINIVQKIIEDTMSLQLEKIRGELQLIKKDVCYIKIQTTKTNGNVIRHDGEIRTLQMGENLHIPNCPHNAAVADFMFLRKYWKALAISGIAVGCISVAGAFITVSNFKELFRKDEITQQKIELGKEVGQKNAAKIQENKKTINDLETEKAFQESLKNDH